MAIFKSSDALDARTELNLSQAKVAADTGINRSYISQYEKGKRILEDVYQTTLAEYYESLGWHADDPENSNDSETKTETEIPEYRIRDGIVIANHLSDEQVETLMSEYQHNGQSILQASKQEVRRGFFGGLDSEENIAKVLRLSLLSLRQCAILEALHGHVDIESGLFNKSKDSTTSVGEYIDRLIHGTINTEDQEGNEIERIPFPLFSTVSESIDDASTEEKGGNFILLGSLGTLALAGIALIGKGASNGG